MSKRQAAGLSMRIGIQVPSQCWSLAFVTDAPGGQPAVWCSVCRRRGSAGMHRARGAQYLARCCRMPGACLVASVMTATTTGRTPPSVVCLMSSSPNKPLTKGKFLKLDSIYDRRKIGLTPLQVLLILAAHLPLIRVNSRCFVVLDSTCF